MSTSENADPAMVNKSSFSLPQFDTFSPAELTDVLVKYREWKLNQQKEHLGRFLLPFPSFSKSGMESRISDCYRASLIPEEGVFPRFQVVMSARTDLNFMMRFANNIPVDSNFFRRIASAIPDNSALYVCEVDGAMNCEGIIPNLWNPQFLGNSLPILHPTFCIRVEAPGDLVVSLESVYYRVKELKASCVLEIGIGDQYLGWLNELTKWVGCKLHNPEQHDFFEAQIEGVSDHYLIQKLWSRIIELSQSMRHGGSFIIRPPDVLDAISFKFPSTSLHLGKEIVEHFNRISADSGRINSERQRLLSYVELIAQLSTVDGCVVFDRELNLMGFGGHIQVNDDLLNRNSRSFVDEERRPLSEDFLKSYGSRHKSAFRICKAYPNHLAFVISQDGSITAFSSNEKHVVKFFYPDFPNSLTYW